MQYLFPSLIIVLMLSAAVVYTVAGEYRLAAYWLFAGGINAVVTY